MKISSEKQHEERIRVVIVDDEPLARDLLRRMLVAHPDLEIAGACADGDEAIAAIKRLRPDLVFLDIQMPECDGFDVLEAVSAEWMPIVIFATAFDRYALRAFDVHALDYLLKPFDEERVEKALDRARDQLRLRRSAGSGVGAGAQDVFGRRVEALLRHMQHIPRYRERLGVRERDRHILLNVDDVDWIEAEGKYVKVHTGRSYHLVRASIGKLEQELDPTRFTRISRSAIVPIARILELRPWFQGNFIVVLKSGEHLQTTRSYRERLTEMFSY